MREQQLLPSGELCLNRPGFPLPPDKTFEYFLFDPRQPHAGSYYDRDTCPMSTLWARRLEEVELEEAFEQRYAAFETKWSGKLRDVDVWKLPPPRGA